MNSSLLDPVVTEEEVEERGEGLRVKKGNRLSSVGEKGSSIGRVAVRCALWKGNRYL